MVKSWQIFAFSLIPLALVLAGVIIGSIYFEGGDSVKEDLSSPEPSSVIEAPAFVSEVRLVQS